MRAPLPHPFVRWEARARRRAVVAFSTLAAVLMLALASLDAGLRTPAAPSGIVSFELAGSAARAARIVAAWGDEGRARAALCLRLDFLFLAAYAPGLALLCAAAADRERAAGSQQLALAGAALSWGQIAAGALDAIENAALLRVLGSADPGGWPLLAAACASPKFLLVAAGLLHVIASGVRSRLRERGAL